MYLTYIITFFYLIIAIVKFFLCEMYLVLQNMDKNLSLVKICFGNKVFMVFIYYYILYSTIFQQDSFLIF